MNSETVQKYALVLGLTLMRILLVIWNVVVTMSLTGEFYLTVKSMPMALVVGVWLYGTGTVLSAAIMWKVRQLFVNS
jgi:hypothetical protein